MKESTQKVTAIVEKLEDDFSSLNHQNASAIQQLSEIAESVVMTLNMTRNAPHNADYYNVYDNLLQRAISVQNQLNKQ